jgi:hypothetical protein
MAVVPAPWNEHVIECFEQARKLRTFHRQLAIQLQTQLRRTGLRINAPLPNRPEVFRHRFDGRAAPRPDVFR